ncbi:MAG TPA: hypothetical protein VKT51_01720 [Candidatus Eremiobacteraceae bacterium]|nr:hypothetical protein [Candidatus Eremiobacteraceae bacterium]
MSATTPAFSQGDIVLFYQPKGHFKLVTLFTRSPYYHVAIAVDERYIVEAMPRGVVRTAIESKRGRRWVVIDPPDKKVAERAVAWAIKRIGDGYDPWDLISLGLDRLFAHLHVNFTSRGRYTCSEFVAAAFKAAGKPLLKDLEPEDTLPSDFARLLPS